MKVILQLLFAGLVINATFQSGRSYWTFYKMQEEVREEILHGRLATFSDLHRRVIEIGGEHGITMAYDDVEVTHRRYKNDIDVQFAYVDNIAFIPGVYSRPWAYDTMVGTSRTRALIVDEQPRR
jgi:hypothetical protein